MEISAQEYSPLHFHEVFLSSPAIDLKDRRGMRGQDVMDCDGQGSSQPSLDESASSEDEDLNMEILHNRVSSFFHLGWDVPFLNVTELAVAGFYYTGCMDLCRCAYCGGVLGQWVPGDIPIQEHAEKFPQCSLIRSTRQLTAVTPEERGEDVCGLYSTFKTTPPQGPASSKMVDYSNRLDTFSRNWPRNRRQRPKDMAAAGLYYTGSGDQTQCFHCGGCLEHWDPTDDPWVEHAKWYPDCVFLISSRGQRFVDSVREGRDGGNSSGYEEGTSGSSTSPESEASVSDSEEDDELEVIKEVLRRKYKQPLVEQAVREKREHLSFARFHSAEELIEAVNVIEERKKTCQKMIEEAKAGVVAPLGAALTEYELLMKENDRLKKERICKVCLDANSEMSFQPCGHCVTCLKCSGFLETCPVCRTVIEKKVRIFLS